MFAVDTNIVTVRQIGSASTNYDVHDDDEVEEEEEEVEEESPRKQT